MTCPLHPEIVKDGPGDCPLCGMALEPMVASLDDGPNPELIDFTRRLWVSALLAVPIVVLAMGGRVPSPLSSPPPHAPSSTAAIAAAIDAATAARPAALRVLRRWLCDDQRQPL